MAKQDTTGRVDVTVSREGAMELLRHTLEQLELHLDDPDNSALSGHGMLGITRDRLSTLYSLLVTLTPAPTDPLFASQG